MIGSSNTKKFKNFQIRWAEKLGYPDDPYLIRWTFILFGYSMRIHHWIKSDDNRYFHDHSSDLLSIVLKGKYWNVKPYDPDKNPDDKVTHEFVNYYLEQYEEYQAENQNSFLLLCILYEGTNDKIKNQLQVYNQSKRSTFL
jgi:hypothetical protein